MCIAHAKHQWDGDKSSLQVLPLIAALIIVTTTTAIITPASGCADDASSKATLLQLAPAQNTFPLMHAMLSSIPSVLRWMTAPRWLFGRAVSTRMLLPEHSRPCRQVMCNLALKHCTGASLAKPHTHALLKSCVTCRQ